MQNMKKKDLLAIITGNPLSNEKVNTLPENLLGILFEDKTSQHNNSSKNSSFLGRSHFSHFTPNAVARYSYTNLKAVVDSNGACDIKRFVCTIFFFFMK